MKSFTFGIFNISAMILIIFLVVYAVCPFNLIDMEQAQRIAKWKSDFERFNYCFSLVDIHEGAMAQSVLNNENLTSEQYLKKISPYFNLVDDKLVSDKKYKYRRKNGRRMSKHSQFFFDKFVKEKDGTMISFRRNVNSNITDKQPLFFMFVDINGEAKPNRVGQDIFFINIFPHEIKALGYDKEYSRLKKNCSPIGSGLYCSEFYLLGGHF